MRAVISVVGKDTVGILARVSSVCMECNVNIIDVNQTVMQDLFAMTMLTDTSACTIPFSEFSDRLSALGNEIGLVIHAMHEDIFLSMHRI